MAKKLNLYLVERTDETDYDQYDSMLIAEESEENAMEETIKQFHNTTSWYSTWSSKENLKATLIGSASKQVKKGEVIISSYNAG